MLTTSNDVTNRALLVAFTLPEVVLKQGVHDAADAERRLDDAGHHLLDCRNIIKTEVIQVNQGQCIHVKKVQTAVSIFLQ